MLFVPVEQRKKFFRFFLSGEKCWLDSLIKCYMSRTGLMWGERLNIDRLLAVLGEGQEVKCSENESDTWDK